jgi:hypothetical protein
MLARSYTGAEAEQSCAASGYFASAAKIGFPQTESSIKCDIFARRHDENAQSQTNLAQGIRDVAGFYEIGTRKRFLLHRTQC